jgi:hypothetical protein
MLALRIRMSEQYRQHVTEKAIGLPSKRTGSGGWNVVFLVTLSALPKAERSPTGISALQYQIQKNESRLA